MHIMSLYIWYNVKIYLRAIILSMYGTMSMYMVQCQWYNVNGTMSTYGTMSKYTWEQSFCRSGLSASPRWSQCLAEPHRGRPAIFSILSSPDYSHKLWHRKKKKQWKKMSGSPCTRGTPRVRCWQGQGWRPRLTSNPHLEPQPGLEHQSFCLSIF